MPYALKYYINELNELEYAKVLSDQSWLIELKNKKSTGCNLMLGSALNTLTVSIVHNTLLGDTRKQFLNILVLVAI
ncbi:hypothetical protein A4_246 [Escherichia phage A4]|nr:hypothetical protein A4_246 [Escherichia phage A4]